MPTSEANCPNCGHSYGNQVVYECDNCGALYCNCCGVDICPSCESRDRHTPNLFELIPGEPKLPAGEGSFPKDKEGIKGGKEKLIDDKTEASECEGQGKKGSKT